MRLAILADIHGNIQALDAVLDDIATQRVDQIIVNGDIVNRGPSNLEALARLEEVERVTTLGNHEDLVRKWVLRDPDIPADWFDDPFWSGVQWVVDQIQGANRMDRMHGLPMSHCIAIPDVPTLLISHGSPRHTREGYGRGTEPSSFDEIAAAYDADIFIGSHTHRPFELEVGGKTFLNTGAVGAPFDGNPAARYLLLSLHEKAWRWEWRAVDYDRDAALTAFKTSGYLDSGDVAAYIFYEELRTARAIYPGFWHWTGEHSLPRSWAIWEQYLNRSQ